MVNFIDRSTQLQYCTAYELKLFCRKSGFNAMFIEFKVSNYRSIGEEQILSLLPASKQKEYQGNIIKKGSYKALNVIALYGPNGSGKSNLLKAMSTLAQIVNSFGYFSSTRKLPYEPFLLREGWSEKPTCYEITFLISENRYRYGFKFNQIEVVEEWLFRKHVSREVSVFQRSGNVIEVSSTLKASSRVIDAAIEATKQNALFLSSCDTFNIEEAKSVLQWFRKYIVVDGLNIVTEMVQTIKLSQDENNFYNQKIKKFFASLDLDIVDLEFKLKKFDDSEIPQELPEGIRNFLIENLSGKESFSIESKHRLYDEKGKRTSNTIAWKLEEKESSGTIKAFKLSGPLLWILENGGVLIIDEIEASMHPIMVIHIINMFLDKEINTKGAQLIFATHDINLLTYGALRRDQIYFSEKNNWESTEIYSLADFVYIEKDGSVSGNVKERPDTDKEKRYFEGKYGAIPNLGKFRL